MNYTYSDSAHRTASDHIKKLGEKILLEFCMAPTLQILDSTENTSLRTPDVPISNVVSHYEINDDELFLYLITVKNKEQLLNDVQSCLNAIKIAQRAADDISQRFSEYMLMKYKYKRRQKQLFLSILENGKNSDVILNRLLQVHSTAFYLKATTSFQLKDLLSTGMKLSWPDLASNINEFRLAVGHERSFMTEMASATHILSKMDNEASITMSSKLAYQLTKLSH
ncbi:unnamed protein product [Adineta ricciae]|uniref:Uncharacterized protein n=1 Tax=Adineta ricciae TaxID=249248 RepID=A0A816DFV6_ADIRI|nr:unnamed protein product [Adineta ricciae]